MKNTRNWGYDNLRRMMAGFATPALCRTRRVKQRKSRVVCTTGVTDVVCSVKGVRFIVNVVQTRVVIVIVKVIRFVVNVVQALVVNIIQICVIF